MITMLLRDRVEEIVRGLLANPATSHAVPSEPVQSASTTRGDLFARVVALREQQERESLPLKAEEARLEGMLTEIMVQVEKLTRQLTNVRGQEFILNINSSTAIDKVVAGLIQSSSPMITNFVTEMNKELDDLRRLTPKEGRGVGDLDPITLIKPKYIFSNSPAISRRVRSVMAAVKRAEELKTIDRTDSELAEEFELLKASLPVIDGELEEVIGD